MIQVANEVGNDGELVATFEDEESVVKYAQSKGYKGELSGLVYIWLFFDEAGYTLTAVGKGYILTTYLRKELRRF